MTLALHGAWADLAARVLLVAMFPFSALDKAIHWNAALRQCRSAVLYHPFWCAADFRAHGDHNLWTGAGDGVHCIDLGGALLGKVVVPAAVSNLTFGGRLRSRLFLCAGPTLYAIAVNRRGCRSP